MRDGVQIAWDTRQVLTDLPIVGHRVAQIYDGTQAWKLSKVKVGGSPKTPDVAIITELKPGVKYAAFRQRSGSARRAGRLQLVTFRALRAPLPAQQAALAGTRLLCAR